MCVTLVTGFVIASCNGGERVCLFFAYLRSAGDCLIACFLPTLSLWVYCLSIYFLSLSLGFSCTSLISTLHLTRYSFIYIHIQNDYFLLCLFLSSTFFSYDTRAQRNEELCSLKVAGGNYRPLGLVPTTTRSGELGKVPVARLGSNIFFMPEFL